MLIAYLNVDRHAVWTLICMDLWCRQLLHEHACGYMFPSVSVVLGGRIDSARVVTAMVDVQKTNCKAALRLSCHWFVVLQPQV